MPITSPVVGCQLKSSGEGAQARTQSLDLRGLFKHNNLVTLSMTFNGRNRSCIAQANDDDCDAAGIRRLNAIWPRRSQLLHSHLYDRKSSAGGSVAEDYLDLITLVY